MFYFSTGKTYKGIMQRLRNQVIPYAACFKGNSYGIFKRF